MDFVARQVRVREQMAQRGLDALLVTHLPNVRYLSGFTGSAGVLLVSSRRSLFFTDGRYREQARAEVTGARILVPKGPALAAAATEISRAAIRTLGIDADHMTVSTQSQLRRMLTRNIKLKNAAGLIETLRIVKDPDEIST